MPTGILRTFFANSLPCPASAPSSSFLPVSSSPPFLPKPRTSLTAPPGRISSLTRSTPAASTRRTSRDVANPPRDSFRTTGIKLNYRVAAQSAQEDILRDFAYGTGGTFYHTRKHLAL